MLRDAAFYIDVPVFTYLRENIADAELAAAAATQAGACPSCGDTWRYYRPAVDAFVMQLDTLITERSAALEHIRAYLKQKKKYDIQQVVIYYRPAPGGSIKKLVF